MACKSKKAVTKNVEVKKDTVKTEPKIVAPKPQKVLNFTTNQWSTFAAKIGINYESEARSLPINNFNGQIKMSKNQFIWISIQVPLLGGEAGRIMITKDSVKIIDRYNKRYMLTTFSYLQKFSSVPLSLEKLQDALMGNPTFQLKDAKYDTTQNMLIALFEDVKIKNTIYALLNTLRVHKNIYIDKIQNVDITAVYNEFETIEGQEIPKKMNFSSTKPEKTNIELENSNIILNKPVNGDFTIPSSYKKWND